MGIRYRYRKRSSGDFSSLYVHSCQYYLIYSVCVLILRLPLPSCLILECFCMSDRLTDPAEWFAFGAFNWPTALMLIA